MSKTRFLLVVVAILNSPKDNTLGLDVILTNRKIMP